MKKIGLNGNGKFTVATIDRRSRKKKKRMKKYCVRKLCEKMAEHQREVHNNLIDLNSFRFAGFNMILFIMITIQ